MRLRAGQYRLKERIIEILAKMALIGCYDPAILILLKSYDFKQLKREAEWAIQVAEKKRPKVVRTDEVRRCVSVLDEKLVLEKVFAIIVENPVLKEISKAIITDPKRTVILLRESEVSQLLFKSPNGRVLEIKPLPSGGLRIKALLKGKSYTFNLELKECVENLRKYIYMT